MTFTYGLENWIAFADDQKHRELDITKITIAAFHRLSFAHDPVMPIPDRMMTGQAAAEMFNDTGKYRAGAYTGGQMPYGLLVLPQGLMHQTLELSEYGPHSRRWSFQAFGVAVIGDFTKHAPTAEQWVSCVEMGALLHAFGCAARGHTELSGASSDARKQCPGPLFDLDALRAEIDAHPYSRLDAHHAALELTAAGFEF